MPNRRCAGPLGFYRDRTRPPHCIHVMCVCHRVSVAMYQLHHMRCQYVVWLIDMCRAITCNPQEATWCADDRSVIHIHEAGIARVGPAQVLLHMCISHVCHICTLERVSRG